MGRFAQHAFDAEEVMAYLDGELERRRAAALAAHLVGCGECQEVAQGFRALSERMLSFEVEAPSARMSDAVLATLDARKFPRANATDHAQGRKGSNWRGLFTRPRNWAIASAVAVVVIILIAVPNVLRQRSGAILDRSLTLYEKLEPAVANSPASDLEARSAANALPASKGLNAVFPEPAPPSTSGDELKAPETVGPMIVQTASLNIVATNYDEASAAIEKLAAAHGGYVEKLDAKAQTGNARELSAALRIPEKQLDGFLADARKLGHVEEESRSNEEVSDQYVDLQARLRSARATEQRLIELLGTRTGKLADVLDAERELARIRSEIESMQGQSAVLVHKVNYATVQVDLSEEYRQVLGTGSISTGTKIRNALVEGLRNLEEGAVAALVFLFADGPSIVFWLAVIGIPAWLAWRRFGPQIRN